MEVDSGVGLEVAEVAEVVSVMTVDLEDPGAVLDTREVATGSVDRLLPTLPLDREVDGTLGSVVVLVVLVVVLVALVVALVVLVVPPVAPVAAGLNVNPEVLPAATVNPSGPGRALVTVIVETAIATATVTVTETVIGGIVIAIVTVTANATAIATGTEVGATTTGGRDTMKMTRMMTPVPKEDIEPPSPEDHHPIPVFGDGWLVGILGLILFSCYILLQQWVRQGQQRLKLRAIGLQPPITHHS